jgi:hypothetical protein
MERGQYPLDGEYILYTTRHRMYAVAASSPAPEAGAPETSDAEKALREFILDLETLLEGGDRLLRRAKQHLDSLG